MDIAHMYEHTIYALGAMALLMFFQVIVADVVGIRSKHIPGASITADHNDLLFRASRTVANTNESISIFVLATLFCILSNAAPIYTAYAAWGFVLARALYALFYYGNFQMLRSVTFGMSLLGSASLLVIGILT